MGYIYTTPTVDGFKKILNVSKNLSNSGVCGSFNINNFSNGNCPAIGNIRFNPESYPMLNSIIKNAYTFRPVPNSSNVVFGSLFNFDKLKKLNASFEKFNLTQSDFGVDLRYHKSYHLTVAEGLSPEEVSQLIGNNLDLKSMAIRGVIRLTTLTLGASLLKAHKYGTEKERAEFEINYKLIHGKESVPDKDKASEKETIVYDTFCEISNGSFLPVKVGISQRDPSSGTDAKDPSRVEHIVESPSISILISDHSPNAIEFTLSSKAYLKDDGKMNMEGLERQGNAIKLNESGTIVVGQDFQRYIKYDKTFASKLISGNVGSQDLAQESPLIDAIETVLISN